MNNLEKITGKDKQEIMDKVLEMYGNDDVSMTDLLRHVEANGLSMEEVVEVYSKLIYTTDNDETITFVGGHEGYLDKLANEGIRYQYKW